VDSYIVSFFAGIATGEIEVYNEFSLQHELGLFLRCQTPLGKIQFERNVSYFSFNQQQMFIKKEIDLSVLEPRTNRPLIAIELKYPKNGQYPEQMFSFCKDLRFIEQLKNAGFQKTYLIILVDDPLFYKGTGEGIYNYFRNQQPVHGTVIKPTGARNEQVIIEGTYVVTWRAIKGAQRYAVIESRI
jgi:hypothetical protein